MATHRLPRPDVDGDTSGRSADCIGTQLGVRWDAVGGTLGRSWGYVGTQLGVRWDAVGGTLGHALKGQKLLAQGNALGSY